MTSLAETAPRVILTAAGMRAAEARVIAAGTSAEVLMERAGSAVTEAVLRGGGSAADVLILCGPGNNGGDGYVAARMLAEQGCDVRVAASAPPTTDAARHARAGWMGEVGAIEDAATAPVVVDALFGTGLSRPLDPALAAALVRLVEASRWSLAVDVPSGVDSDTGALLSPAPIYAHTLALGALKPAHLLAPAARYAGSVEVADIGVPVEGPMHVLAAPRLRAPGPDDHKYTRGLVTVIGGAMPGAAALSALGAAHAGAGYVQLLAPTRIAGLPHAIVQRSYGDAAGLASMLADQRISAVVLGPGLGSDDDAQALAVAATRSGRPLVVDADALALIDFPLPVPAILTPHMGEFDRLFGPSPASRIERAADAARRSGAVVVLKGSTTVIAAPDGRMAVSEPLPAGLATAGTGDVLAGVCGTMLAQLGDPFVAASAAVWLHGEAARRVPASFVADALASSVLSAAVASCW